MTLSREIAEFAQTFSTVSNTVARAQYLNARAEAASTPKPKDAAEAGAIAAGEAEKLRFDQRASAIPTDAPTPKPSNGQTPLDVAEVSSYTQEAAKKRGIDPSIAVKVAGLEGLTGYTGDAGSSFGPFQLHYGNVAPGGNKVAGLGDDFTKATGLDARDPATWKQQVDFALDHAKNKGWGAFHGWKGDQFAGIARSAIPAFAAGGLVGDDGMSDLPELDTPSALPVSEAPPAVPAQAGPSAFDPMQLVAKVGGALHDGMQYLQSFFGLNEATAGAIPGGQSAADGMRRFLSHEGEASPEDYEAVVRTVDPKRQLNDGLRNAAGLAAVHDYWLSKGDPEKAAKTAGSLLKYMRGLSARYGTEAVDHLRAGRFEDAKSALNRSIDQMPDGKSLDIAMSPDGSAAVVQKDAKGRPIAQTRLSPEQLLGVATGLSDSTLYWKTLVESAGKYDPESQAGSEAYQQALGGLTPQTGQPAQPQQAVPTTVTQEGNAPQPAQALPVQQAIPDVPMATPEQLAQMSPRERSSYLTARNQMVREHGQQVSEMGREHRADLRTQRQIDAEDRREARKQSAIPTPETRQHLSASIGQSMEDFKAGLPQGTTLPAHLEHGYKTAAFAIARDNNIDPSEAVFAADELASLNSRALASASAGEGGRMRVQLGNGSQLTLDQSAYNALRQLRAKQGEEMKAKSEKHQESDAAYTRAGNVIERGASLAAKNSAIGRAAPYAQAAGGALQDWLKSQWDAYQNSKDPRTVTLNDK